LKNVDIAERRRGMKGCRRRRGRSGSAGDDLAGGNTIGRNRPPSYIRQRRRQRLPPSGGVVSTAERALRAAGLSVHLVYFVLSDIDESAAR